MKLRKACVLCGHEFSTDPVLTLPDTPLANEFVAEPRPQKEFPLNLYLCADCGHLQLQAVIDPDYLFSDYVYTSGTSVAAIRHWADYAENLIDRYALDAKAVVMDIGSNDGIFLKQFTSYGVRQVHGVEPARDIAARANLAGVPTTNAFFDHEIADELRRTIGLADVVTANNVFAHADDLESIVLAAQSLLKPEGVLVFEVSYLLDVVQRLLFDTIYHEHLSYHAVRPLLGFFERLGMTLFDVTRVPAQGGSLRCHVSKQRQPISWRVSELVALEDNAELFEAHTYHDFSHAVDVRSQRLREQLIQVRMGGGRLCGYGAPAKLTTLMYALKLDGADFDFVVDDSPFKQGLFTPGKHVRVMDREALWQVSGQEYTCVVFAWNFFDSIVQKNESWNGHWLNPLDA